MDTLFINLTRAVDSTPMVALGASFLWGILSIILSPCHLASIPLIVGFINGQGRIPTRRAFFISSLFSLGILVTIALIGAVTTAMGRMMGDVGRIGNYLVALIFFAVGLHLLDVLVLPLPGPAQVGMKRRGALAALVLGLLFGIALGPCTFAFMAPVLAATFRLAHSDPVYSTALLLVYGIGHCSVIVLAGTSTGLLQKYLDWNERSRGGTILRKSCGILVILAGVYLLSL